MRRRSFAPKPQGPPPCRIAVIRPDPVAFGGFECGLGARGRLLAAEGQASHPAGTGRGQSAAIRVRCPGIGSLPRPEGHCPRDLLDHETDRFFFLLDSAIPPYRLRSKGRIRRGSLPTDLTRASQRGVYRIAL